MEEGSGFASLVDQTGNFPVASVYKSFGSRIAHLPKIQIVRICAVGIKEKVGDRAVCSCLMEESQSGTTGSKRIPSTFILMRAEIIFYLFFRRIAAFTKYNTIAVVLGRCENTAGIQTHLIGISQDHTNTQAFGRVGSHD